MSNKYIRRLYNASTDNIIAYKYLITCLSRSFKRYVN